MNTYKPSNQSDELNQDFLFSMTHSELLSAIAKGQIDPVQAAKQELANRGLNLDGKWVGFKQAELLNNLKK